MELNFIVRAENNGVQLHIVYTQCINSLGTALFCCKFNLVDTDQFSGEYLVWVLCYCSQTDVFFPHWVGALAHTETLRMPRPLRE